jgi:vacuolar-type H+-ATPase subunit E/Vma4
MTEERQFKESFKNLALAMIENAKNEIKDINEQTLYQRAELKKRYIEENKDISQKIRNNFIDTYNRLLNQSISSMLLSSRKSLLNLKNKLINELKDSIFNVLLEKINNNYSIYIDYVLNMINSISYNFDKSVEIEILLNERDYDYFIKNTDKLKSIIKNDIAISNANKDFAGGFKILLSHGKISYNYTLKNIINKNSTLIQVEISKIVDDSSIREIEKNFEEFIENQKLKIEQFLRNYDNI